MANTLFSANPIKVLLVRYNGQNMLQDEESSQQHTLWRELKNI